MRKCHETPVTKRIILIGDHDEMKEGRRGRGFLARREEQRIKIRARREREKRERDNYVAACCGIVEENNRITSISTTTNTHGSDSKVFFSHSSPSFAVP